MSIPKLRFKGFSNHWESPLIEEVFELKNGYTPSKQIPQYWTNGTIPWFRMEDIRANGGVLYDSIQHITPEAVKGSGLFKPFSIIMATTATIGEHAMLIVDSLANQRFTNFKVRKSLTDKYDPFFVYYSFFKVDSWAKRNTNSGGLLSVDIKTLVKQPFYVPCKDEQTQISAFFGSLDKQIQASAKKVESLKQLKQASLVSMFPQQGETKPRVRFKGFTEEWTEMSLNDIVVPSGVKNRDNIPLESYSISNERGFMPQDEKFENGGTMRDADKSMYYIVTPNSFAYNPARINIGSIGYYEGNKDVIISSLYVVFKTDQSVCDDHYLLLWFKSNQFKRLIQLYQEGGVRLYFFYDKLIQCKLLLPSVEEQRQIAQFFTTLDKQISLETQRLEKLKQIKSACLDKMFV